MLLFRTVYRNKLLCGILDPLFFFVEFDFSKTLLSLVLGPAGVTLVLVNPSAFSFLTLSDKFAAATAANQRILLLAVGEVVPVSSLWHGSGAISGGLQSGHFRCGLPYNRAGHGPRPLVVFPGLTFENKPQFGTLSIYKFLQRDYTLFSVYRKPGMPRGYTLREMGNDYATMIWEEFGGPVDVLGVSTGGSIALHFAADHPDLVCRLVIHSSAHTLNTVAKVLQLHVARLALQCKWRQAWAAILRTVFPQKGPGKWLTQPMVGFSAWLLSLNPPQDPNDIVAAVEAEDQHAFKDRLVEIAAPTLVTGGVQDFFYSPSLFRETADGIPNARLCLYERMGHPATGKRFHDDVLVFLRR